MRRPYSRIGSTVQVAFTAASGGTSDPLAHGHYRIAATTACFIRAGSTAQTAVTTDAFIPAGGTIDHFVGTDGSGQHVAAIRQTADGVLTITKVYP